MLHSSIWVNHRILSNIYTGEGKNKRIYSSKYALSAITFCGDCGDIYRRTYWNIHGRKEFVWRCVTRIEQGPEVCKNRTVKEDDVETIYNLCQGNKLFYRYCQAEPSREQILSDLYIRPEGLRKDN